MAWECLAGVRTAVYHEQSLGSGSCVLGSGELTLAGRSPPSNHFLTPPASTSSHQHTKGQPVPGQWLLWKAHLPDWCWAWCFMGWNISLFSCGQLSWLCLSLCFLHPSLLAEGQSAKQNAVILTKNHLAIAKTLLCYQQHFGHKSKTWHYMGCYKEKLSLCQLDTVTNASNLIRSLTVT